MNAPSLKAGECHVWWARPQDRRIESLIGVLDAVELQRVPTYRRDEDRIRFVTACWLLRTAAGAQLGVAPEEVPVERGCDGCGKPHGRPRILSPDPLHVSVSHSGERVAVALTATGPVGVDVEVVPDAPLRELVRCALSPAESAALETLPEEERHAAFARLWTRKEAVLKATGHGLRIAPNKVEVSEAWEHPELIAWPLEIPPAALQLRTLFPGDGYTGAVAIITDHLPITVVERNAAELGPADFPAAAPLAA
ncbi:4'-phosphopantetheinyl transferase [Sphaerisporangium siamense]|uniref:4'-phosphopantetheinyl transferase n=1 Tax=Sphaerisporangium siamense TaxID=795645 RepID=A0A7W7D9K0_9ACTN|nr:4'-phosphopantetheinyl transferase superfamily protein [Sphaerisporangium siamense]MBB4702484.1 4'-phosphopantetheinyl transferase [Sphaerisporangium siamense]GII88181.1 4'-phosphopantetheinyl transferase [Sphaerisporangium siamense]